MAIRIIVALVLTALAVSVGVPELDPSATTTSPEPAWSGVSVVGLENDSALSIDVDVAVARFAEVGLELPAVTVEFHDSAAPCNGHDGLIRFSGPAPVISICSDRPYVLSHELAHAWVDANLTEEAKAAYVEHWGLASWDSKQDDWNDRGTEHAAFTIQQNLMATPHRMTSTWIERAEAFEILTGIESPLSREASD